MSIEIRSDRYTKTLLTVIAGCLVWLCIGGPSMLPGETAKADPPIASQPSDSGRVEPQVNTGTSAPATQTTAAHMRGPRDERREKWETRYKPDQESLTIRELRIVDESERLCVLVEARSGTTRLVIAAPGNRTKKPDPFEHEAIGSPTMFRVEASAHSGSLELRSDEAVFGLLGGGISYESFTDQETKFSICNRLSSISLMQDSAKGGSIMFDDRGGHSRLALQCGQDGKPSVTLLDDTGKSRATLGVAELEKVQTGASERTAESSLTLFDKAGKVMWRTPQ